MNQDSARQSRLGREWSAGLEGRVVATAESCTGGLLEQALAKLEGSRAWYRGGVIAYQSQAKFDVLGVSPGPVVNEPAARRMVEGTARLVDADIAVAATGGAGPAPQDGASPGTVVIGALVEGGVTARTPHLEGDPEEVCERACNAASQDLLAAAGVPAVPERA
jgi:nicotinamide-nucleotide amidase